MYTIAASVVHSCKPLVYVYYLVDTQLMELLLLMQTFIKGNAGCAASCACFIQVVYKLTSFRGDHGRDSHYKVHTFGSSHTALNSVQDMTFSMRIVAYMRLYVTRCIFYFLLVLLTR